MDIKNRDKNKIDLLQKGKIPIYEPGLSELVVKNFRNKRLSFSTNLQKSVKESDIIFICVGTPTKKGGSSADLSQIYNVAKEISSSINKFKIIITKSTVPVTTGDEIEKIIESLEEGNLSLEDSIEAYEKGISLTKACQKMLSDAELKIKKLSSKENWSSGLINNEKALEHNIIWNKSISESEKKILFDPQTSGGLLFTVDKSKSSEFQRKLSKNNLSVSKIGITVEKTNFEIEFL